jgi:hypothetical protein
MVAPVGHADASRSREGTGDPPITFASTSASFTGRTSTAAAVSKPLHVSGRTKRIVVGADKTAHWVEWVGDRTVHTTEGTAEEVGKGSKTVAVKTADGTKETFVVADHGAVNSGKDIARYSARGVKKGEHVTVYYTEDVGRKSLTCSSTSKSLRFRFYSRIFFVAHVEGCGT